MAELNEAKEDLRDHRNNLKRLCRVCGGTFEKRINTNAAIAALNTRTQRVAG